MNVNDYQNEALRTAQVGKCPDELLMEAALGLAGESGEVADIVKKVMFQGHLLDDEHIAKELGDVAWYLSLATYAIGYKLETILEMNVEKLRNRYPNGFESDRSVNREEGDI